MEEIKSQFVKLYNENKRVFKEIALKEANLNFMTQKKRIMEDINAEKILKLQEKRHILDDLQNRVFQEKRQLCSKVRIFSDEYGLLAMMKNPKDFPFQHRRWLNTSQGICIHACEDEHQVESIIAAVEAELSVADTKLEVSRLHLASVQEEHLHLLPSPTDGHKLQEIQDLKQQTELLEAQCEAVQQELGWQYLILKQAVNVENSRQKADDTEQTAELSGYTGMVVAKVTGSLENSTVENKQAMIFACLVKVVIN
ncbi:hypothetical protein B7P43_G05216 [Cryptotermes secundus]|uniref:Uncharacterized protein n=2 Tax=Cryptotermes secundus TaxID=105785 RepID=A0A2J7PLJ9_9NEOP|nr:uncharacterized protein LOC111873144 isoform X2 [Cryptotermes secundus]PNF17214.1 hypothetical protein B7P43_G05216 [Cryptotermes secundus]